MTKMAFEFNDLKGFLFLVLFTIPLTTSTNINCNGKPFHCLNETHFMICVDLGAGVSATIDDFIIPCPPTTMCHESNKFECEFPKVPPTLTAEDKTVSLNDSVKISQSEVTTVIPLTENTKTVLEERTSLTNIEILENLKEEYTGGSKKIFEKDTIIPTSAGSPLHEKEVIPTKSNTNEIHLNVQSKTATTENIINVVLVTDHSPSIDTTTPAYGLLTSKPKDTEEVNQSNAKIVITEPLLTEKPLDLIFTTLTPYINIEKNFDLDKPPDNISLSNNADNLKSIEINFTTPETVLDTAEVASIITEKVPSNQSAMIVDNTRRKMSEDASTVPEDNKVLKTEVPWKDVTTTTQLIEITGVKSSDDIPLIDIVKSEKPDSKVKQTSSTPLVNQEKKHDIVSTDPPINEYTNSLLLPPNDNHTEIASIKSLKNDTLKDLNKTLPTDDLIFTGTPVNVESNHKYMTEIAPTTPINYDIVKTTLNSNDDKMYTTTPNPLDKNMVTTASSNNEQTTTFQVTDVYQFNEYPFNETATTMSPTKMTTVLPLTETNTNTVILENLKEEYTQGDEKIFDKDTIPTTTVSSLHPQYKNVSKLESSLKEQNLDNTVVNDASQTMPSIAPKIITDQIFEVSTKAEIVTTTPSLGFRKDGTKKVFETKTTKVPINNEDTTSTVLPRTSTDDITKKEGTEGVTVIPQLVVTTSDGDNMYKFEESTTENTNYITTTPIEKQIIPENQINITESHYEKQNISTTTESSNKNAIKPENVNIVRTTEHISVDDNGTERPIINDIKTTERSNMVIDKVEIDSTFVFADNTMTQSRKFTESKTEEIPTVTPTNPSYLKPSPIITYTPDIATDKLNDGKIDNTNITTNYSSNAILPTLLHDTALLFEPKPNLTLEDQIIVINGTRRTNVYNSGPINNIGTLNETLQYSTPVQTATSERIIQREDDILTTTAKPTTHTELVKQETTKSILDVTESLIKTSTKNPQLNATQMINPKITTGEVFTKKEPNSFNLKDSMPTQFNVLNQELPKKIIDNPMPITTNAPNRKTLVIVDDTISKYVSDSPVTNATDTQQSEPSTTEIITTQTLHDNNISTMPKLAVATTEQKQNIINSSPVTTDELHNKDSSKLISLTVSHNNTNTISKATDPTVEQKQNILNKVSSETSVPPVKPDTYEPESNKLLSGRRSFAESAAVHNNTTQIQANAPVETTTDPANVVPSKVETININDPMIFSETIFTNRSINNSIHLQNKSHENVKTDKAALQIDMVNITLNSKTSSNISNREDLNLETENIPLIATQNNVDIGIDNNKSILSRQDVYESSTTNFEITSQTEITYPQVNNKNSVNNMEISPLVSDSDTTFNTMHTESQTTPLNVPGPTNTTNGLNKTNYGNGAVNISINLFDIDNDYANNSRKSGINKTNMEVDLYKNVTEHQNISNSNVKRHIDNLYTSKTQPQPGVKSSNQINKEQKTISINMTNSAPLFDCTNRTRGKYADSKDCRKFYICLGNLQAIAGTCPNDTVFSEINKQCTRNLSHCVRNNQFHCLYEGRFSDFFKDNIYYICVKHNLHGFLRFKLQCQDGYHLNKVTVKCIKNEVITSQSMSSNSENSQASNDQNEGTIKSEEGEKPENDFKCKKEGKFPYKGDCRKYYECSKTKNDEYRRKIKKCTDDEVYDKEKSKCKSSESSEC